MIINCKEDFLECKYEIKNSIFINNTAKINGGVFKY